MEKNLLKGNPIHLYCCNFEPIENLFLHWKECCVLCDCINSFRLYQAELDISFFPFSFDSVRALRKEFIDSPKKSIPGISILFFFFYAGKKFCEAFAGYSGIANIIFFFISLNGSSWMFGGIRLSRRCKDRLTDKQTDRWLKEQTNQHWFLCLMAYQHSWFILCQIHSYRRTAVVLFNE